MLAELEPFLRSSKLPHLWCPGCGNGIVLGSLLRAINRVERDPNQIVIVSGIGCSSRATAYLNFDTLHTTHGRAIAFATGIKLANPNLTVIVITGDGDCTAIGGNHLIHAARRNLDLTVLVFNNNIYGMTGGQYSPTTPTEGRATTAPYGNIERPFDLIELAKAAGATYLGRATAYHNKLLTRLLVNAIINKGFSLVEAITHCPVGFGKRNGIAVPADMLKWQRDHAVTVQAAAQMTQEELADKVIIGELYSNPEPEYTEQYSQLVARAQNLGGGMGS
ncbi:2-oxoacid:ferredoxin oxidoreductase subunit beta [Calderihabitans maritimus]|uniref:2-oxoglutarate synthase n=1 Tax=Calderihabitans maritimus TaxID=1246530 RepID=A0A1Z5HQX2_9FIRM|nr:2-oxoacid:ferredoxin oxidoreductase subunit beta [Calderihabitans maritimus]GAW91932.1 2-oxoglutarate synthase [Calderihabitans maritimus]